MSTFEPELGQMAFGQPHKEFACPAFVEAALAMIDSEMERVAFNKDNHSDYRSPFGNTGESYKNDVFEVCAYSWGDDEQPYNFKCGDVEISWYKHMGRGMSSSVQITPALMALILDACLEAVRAEDVL